jgi:hypothetical protein
LSRVAADRRRQPENTPLYQIVQEHLETFLAQARDRSGHGFGYPRYVEQAFSRYIDCGILVRGFARCRCPDCGDEFLVAFSCKWRGLCPSCATRRMHDMATRLVDEILPRAPYRQWAISAPWSCRMALIKSPAQFICAWA